MKICCLVFLVLCLSTISQIGLASDGSQHPPKHGAAKQQNTQTHNNKPNHTTIQNSKDVSTSKTDAEAEERRQQQKENIEINRSIARATWAIVVVASLQFIAILTQAIVMLRQRNRYREIAAARLREVFSPEMAKMRQQMESRLGTDVPIDILNALDSRMPQYWGAIEQFRTYLPRRKKKPYDEAWQAYYWHAPAAYAKKADIPTYFERIEKILNFAK